MGSVVVRDVLENLVEQAVRLELEVEVTVLLPVTSHLVTPNYPQDYPGSFFYLERQGFACVNAVQRATKAYMYCKTRSTGALWFSSELYHVTYLSSLRRSPFSDPCTARVQSTRPDYSLYDFRLVFNELHAVVARRDSRADTDYIPHTAYGITVY